MVETGIFSIFKPSVIQVAENQMDHIYCFLVICSIFLRLPTFIADNFTTTTNKKIQKQKQKQTKIKQTKAKTKNC